MVLIIFFILSFFFRRVSLSSASLKASYSIFLSKCPIKTSLIFFSYVLILCFNSVSFFTRLSSRIWWAPSMTVSSSVPSIVSSPLEMIYMNFPNSFSKVNNFPFYAIWLALLAHSFRTYTPCWKNCYFFIKLAICIGYEPLGLSWQNYLNSSSPKLAISTLRLRKTVDKSFVLSFKLSACKKRL